MIKDRGKRREIQIWLIRIIVMPSNIPKVNNLSRLLSRLIRGRSLFKILSRAKQTLIRDKAYSNKPGESVKSVYHLCLTQILAKLHNKWTKII